MDSNCMGKIEITKRDLLTPYDEFEREHDITQTRNDIPYDRFDPSNSYKVADMNGTNLKKLIRNVDGLRNKLGYTK